MHGRSPLRSFFHREVIEGAKALGPTEARIVHLIDTDGDVWGQRGQIKWRLVAAILGLRQADVADARSRIIEYLTQELKDAE